MGTNAYTDDCPHCGDDEAHYNHHSGFPFSYINIECLKCGFYTNTESGMMSADELKDAQEYVIELAEEGE